MQRRNHLTWTAILFGLVYAAVLLTSCSGGGSGSASIGDAATGGNVALFFSDAPTDYQHIWLHVSSAYLIPADGGNKVIIFESKNPDGVTVDLLNLKDQQFLVAARKNVPPGVYSKIRLEIIDVYVEGGDGPCVDDYLEIKLPSGKIDLNPRKNFEVKRGETLAIHLDWDMEKSIQLKPAGNSGKCILRPVVFVDIETVISRDRCPGVITGRIDELILNDSRDVIGFKLDLQDDRGILDVYLTDETVIFDERGVKGTSDDLREDQIVDVRGRLNPKCNFEASVVVIGGITKFTGTVIDSTENGFTLKLANNAGTLQVSLTDDTIIYIGCDQPYDDTLIPLGYKARVIGKFEVVDLQNTYWAIVVFLTADRPSGLLTAIEKVDGGYNLTVMVDDQTEKIVFLPDGAPVKMLGDGAVEIERLYEWVNCHNGVPVEVVLEAAATDPPTAEKLLVVPDEISEKVTGTEQRDGLLILETASGDIAVEPNATIYRLKNGELIPLEYEDIRKNDEFTAYGVNACSDDQNNVIFYAYVIIL